MIFMSGGSLIVESISDAGARNGNKIDLSKLSE